MKDDDLEFTMNFDQEAAQSSSALSSSGIDTITITGIDYSSMNTITLPSISGSVGSAGNYYISNTTSSPYTINQNWTNGTNAVNTVHINNTGIDMAAGTDIKIDGKSLKAFMDKMEQRLSILVPDPAKLEKFEALKKAYEHYKTMESLCFDEPEEDKE